MDTKQIDAKFDSLRDSESRKWEEFRAQQDKEFAAFVENFAKD